MSAAIRTMKEIAKGRRVAVLGDMLELGDVAKEAHRRVGEELAKSGAAALVTRGTLGEEIAAGAEKAGMTEVYRCASHEEAAATLKKKRNAKRYLKGDAILSVFDNNKLTSKV